jgi:hypothetical protein
MHNVTGTIGYYGASNDDPNSSSQGFQAQGAVGHRTPLGDWFALDLQLEGDLTASADGIGAGAFARTMFGAQIGPIDLGLTGAGGLVRLPFHNGLAVGPALKFGVQVGGNTFNPADPNTITRPVHLFVRVEGGPTFDPALGGKSPTVAALSFGCQY